MIPMLRGLRGAIDDAIALIERLQPVLTAWEVAQGAPDPVAVLIDETIKVEMDEIDVAPQLKQAALLLHRPCRSTVRRRLAGLHTPRAGHA